MPKPLGRDEDNLDREGFFGAMMHEEESESVSESEGQLVVTLLLNDE